jgi:hypothetical protein
METYAPQIRNLAEAESAKKCMKLLKKATVEDAGSFKNLDGSTLASDVFWV